MLATRWTVITGAPCSGKTAVIRRLADQGHAVVHEAARALIDEALAAGQTLADAKADIGLFERRILLRKVRIESLLPRMAAVFLDRAVPDSIAYFKAAGLTTAEPWRYSQRFRYRRICILESLDFEADGVRSENPQEAARLGQWIAESYRMLGYTPLKVPVMPVGRRAEFILENL